MERWPPRCSTRPASPPGDGGRGRSVRGGSAGRRCAPPGNGSPGSPGPGRPLLPSGGSGALVRSPGRAAHRARRRRRAAPGDALRPRKRHAARAPAGDPHPGERAPGSGEDTAEAVRRALHAARAGDGAGHRPCRGFHRAGGRPSSLGEPVRDGPVLRLAGGESLAPSARPGREGGIPLEQIPIERAIATGSEVRNAEIDLVVDSEAPRHLVGSAAPLRAPGGEVTGAVAAFVDITEQHRAAQALRDSDRRKTEFLAVLSHELRNPLAAIVNAAHLLSLPRATEQQGRRAREVIERQTGQLSRLVDDLLDLTRIERGKVSLRTRRIDLSETVRRTCEDHQQLFEDRGISLHCRTRGGVWIEADPTRMAQILGNLLQNAARYGQPGGKVVVEAARRSAVAELRVRDDGRGIAPDLLERLFTPFVRSEDELSRAHGGLGLGLSLVKGLVELHGGTVQARSDGPGRGAEFIVTLPAVEPPAAAKVDRSSPEARRPLLVLLVEDNRDGAQMLADVLASEGHQVHLAPDGRTALAVARRLAPDVVLCDIGLPDMDGYALAHALRKEPALAHTRLIALSGYAQREDRARAREAGFEAHLVKPADLDELERVLGLAAPRAR